MKSLENLQKALEDKKDTFNSQLVAFPQHGVYYTESASIMRDAAQAGIDFIGGLDPNAVDGNIKRTIDFTVDLALEYKKGIDIHLHEGGQAGIDTIELLCKHVKENQSLQGNTYLSHCFVLAQMEKTNWNLYVRSLLNLVLELFQQFLLVEQLCLFLRYLNMGLKY